MPELRRIEIMTYSATWLPAAEVVSFRKEDKFMFQMSWRTKEIHIYGLADPRPDHSECLDVAVAYMTAVGADPRDVNQI